MKDVSWHVFDVSLTYRSPNQNQEQFESIHENLIDMVSGINNQQPTCSILVGDFNAKLSKWCPSDKDSKAGQEIGTFTTASVYTQMIGQPTHIINEKSSCIDLLFTTYNKLLCNVGVEQTIYNKRNHNIIYRDYLISTYIFLHLSIGKFGITKTQVRYVYNVQFH